MARTPLTSVAISVVALVAACGLVAFGALVSVQAAVFGLAGLAFVAAVARLALPATKVFTVRRRAVDVSIMVAFALALAYLGATTPLT
jgi:hypothetical protein